MASQRPPDARTAIPWPRRGGEKLLEAGRTPAGGGRRPAADCDGCGVSGIRERAERCERTRRSGGRQKNGWGRPLAPVEEADERTEAATEQERAAEQMEQGMGREDLFFFFFLGFD